MTMTRTFIASAMLMLASAASANNPIVLNYGNPPTARIGYSDVDLGSTLGRRTVEHRIQIAARQICVGAEDTSAVPQPMHGFVGCYNLAKLSGLSQLAQLAGK